MTEEERNQPATKGDVRDAIAEAAAPLATKEELKALASKEELNAAVAKLATKEELEQGFTRLMEAILEVQRSIPAAVAAAVEAAVEAAVPAAVEAAIPAAVEAAVEAAVQRAERNHPAMIDAAVQRALKISDEDWARRVAVLDEKYQDLPPRVTAVEDDLAEHKRDLRLHKRPRPS